MCLPLSLRPGSMEPYAAEKYGILEQGIYNMDETGFQVGLRLYVAQRLGQAMPKPYSLGIVNG